MKISDIKFCPECGAAVVIVKEHAGYDIATGKEVFTSYARCSASSGKKSGPDGLRHTYRIYYASGYWNSRDGRPEYKKFSDAVDKEKK